MKTERVLVTDGDQRAALAVVRSLGRAGYSVYVCSHRRHSLASASRFAAGAGEVPDPLENAADYADGVARLCAQWNCDVLLPITEASLLALLNPPLRPRGVIIPFPSYSEFRAISDKHRLLATAAEVGLHVPIQAVVEDRDRFNPDAFVHVGYPLVLKPARSVGETESGSVKVGVLHAATPAQLAERIAGLPDAAFPLLIQQRITGPGSGLFVLLWDDVLRAVFAHRRIREKPPSGGVSVLSESIAADPAIVAKALALFRRFNWQGVGMLELKFDEKTATPYVMEVNGRFWGSLQLAIDAGVDFPRLLLDCVNGTPPAALPPYRSGVRTRWWWGDVDHLIARLRRSRARLDLPAHAPGRLRALVDFLKPGGAQQCSEVFRRDDVGPAMRETMDWLRRR